MGAPLCYNNIKKGEYQIMSLKYKIDVIAELKKSGFTTYRMRKEKIFGERQLQQIRDGEIVSNAVLDKLCKLLNCQPGDILEYVDDNGV